MADLLVQTSAVIFILSNFVVPAAISQALIGKQTPYNRCPLQLKAVVYAKVISVMVPSISTA